MFTKHQLQLLIDAQYGQDWTCKYFQQAIINRAYDSNISRTELDELISIIENYSIEQVQKLQMALSYLGDI